MRVASQRTIKDSSSRESTRRSSSLRKPPRQGSPGTPRIDGFDVGGTFDQDGVVRIGFADPGWGDRGFAKLSHPGDAAAFDPDLLALAPKPSARRRPLSVWESTPCLRSVFRMSSFRPRSFREPPPPAPPLPDFSIPPMHDSRGSAYDSRHAYRHSESENSEIREEEP